jgi:MurNAc alpha-1-phosphate uridylyltransferase
MVLAAGLGTRMRPFNGRLPKPLVSVGGKALIDYVLDRLAEQGVERAVVNVHHLADQIERHLAQRERPDIVISDERDELLGTGGGVLKALPLLGEGPFFHVNSDTIWIDGVKPNLGRLAAAFDPARMDALLLLAPTASSIGYSGRGDFSMGPDGRLARRGDSHHRLFCGGPAGPLFDVAIVRPCGGSRAALRPAPRWRLDACRHARSGQSGRGCHPRQRGMIL